MIRTLEQANLCAIHAGRVTVKKSDIDLSFRVQDMNDYTDNTLFSVKKTLTSAPNEEELEEEENV